MSGNLGRLKGVCSEQQLLLKIDVQYEHVWLHCAVASYSISMFEDVDNLGEIRLRGGERLLGDSEVFFLRDCF